jgi:hypothetical protein
MSLNEGQRGESNRGAKETFTLFPPPPKSPTPLNSTISDQSFDLENNEMLNDVIERSSQGNDKPQTGENQCGQVTISDDMQNFLNDSNFELAEYAFDLAMFTSLEIKTFAPPNFTMPTDGNLSNPLLLPSSVLDSGKNTVTRSKLSPIYIPEILEIVFNYLRNEKELHSCLFICKIWNLTATRVIWQKVSIGSMEKFVAFSKVFIDFPYMIDCLRYHTLRRVSTCIDRGFGTLVKETLRDSKYVFDFVKKRCIDLEKVNLGNLPKSFFESDQPRFYVGPTPENDKDVEENWYYNYVKNFIKSGVLRFVSGSIDILPAIPDVSSLMSAYRGIREFYDAIYAPHLFAEKTRYKSIIACPYGALITHLTLHRVDILTDSILMPVLQSCRNLIHLEIYACTRITDDSIITVAEYCNNLRILCIPGCKSISDQGMTVLLKKCPLLEVWEYAYLLTFHMLVLLIL